jgi:hypothetical protein
MAFMGKQHEKRPCGELNPDGIITLKDILNKQVVKT